MMMTMMTLLPTDNESCGIMESKFDMPKINKPCLPCLHSLLQNFDFSSSETYITSLLISRNIQYNTTRLKFWRTKEAIV